MEAAAQRMRAQWLTDRPHATVVAVAAHAVGVQAQDTGAARLAIRARSVGTTADDVRRAAAGGDVVRTWLMRGTLHLVAASDVRWLLAIFAPRDRAAGARRRAQLDLDDETTTRALIEIERVLAQESPLSRADLIGRLASRGVPVDPRGQAPAHLMGFAAMSGLICRGPDLGRDEPGYVLLDEWVPPAPPHDPEEAVAGLARRYLHAFGPAGPADFALWSGLPLGTARLAVGAAAQSADDPQPSVPARTGPAVRLLGAFDNYLLGYRDVLDGRHAARIKPGGGIVHPAVLVDGRVAGRWRLRRDRRAVEIDMIDGDRIAVEPLLAAEVADIGRFMGTELGLA
jgi:hypothetical protein